MKFVLVYVAAFLAFLSQFIRDFSVLNYSEMVSPATVFGYIYITQSALSFILNVVLFKGFSSRQIYAAGFSLFGVSVLALLALLSDYDFALVFILISYGVLSAIFGNILLFSERLFLSRSREFFLHVLALILILVVSMDFSIAYVSMALAMSALLIPFYFLSKVNYSQSLPLKSTLVFGLPSVVFQLVLFFFSLEGYYRESPMELRSAVYVNSLFLAPILLLKSSEMKSLMVVKRYSIYVFLASLIALIGVYFHRFDIPFLFPICMGLFFVGVTYWIASIQFIKIKKA